MARATRKNPRQTLTDVAAAYAPLSVQGIVAAGGGGDPTMKMTAVIMGDSIVNQAHSEYNSGTIRTANSNGWWTHLNCRLGHRFKLLRNSGIPGETTTQQAARFQADVVALAPGWVFLGGPTNDTSLTQAETVANLVSMWNAADAAGIRIVQLTVTPKTGATTVVKDRANEINNYLRRTARERKGLVLIDWNSKLSVGSSMDWKLGHTNVSDTSGLHPNPQGAAAMGQIAAERVALMTPAIDVCPQNNGDASNLIVNPLQFGTAGTIGAGGSGQLSDSWRVDPLSTTVFTCRKVARTDGIPGFWQEITLVSGELKIGQNITGFGTVYNTADQLYALAEFQTDTDIPANTTSRVRLNLIAMKPDFGVGAQGIDMEQTAGIVFPEAQYFPRQGVFQTPLVVVPSTATLRMAFQFEVRGSGTFRIGRSGMYKAANGPGADVWAGVIPA
ncbi:hypothetical protein CH278_02215 [Rhodococcus sp. 05-2254-5]|uniref:SGNH/GDSL hydrolase family protein n=1 Tax=unclassified Rhodococcus (in: high G+C Gram-positive bacteria) TaxID=192944 RepID=UPI000B9B4630|nr:MULTISPECIES: GDSL-type esterase/lipase family protein [unclassified Rhodococcus (in: high G+C Gram-positive bacteria)]OZE39118.1 hypothetical protein CH278_02215 [Rhodococcus sp. 05-2254-5]OZE59059.1 hypothetical protein CH269_08710 [Rhodococcus sp. 05-2254-1]